MCKTTLQGNRNAPGTRPYHSTMGTRRFTIVTSNALTSSEPEPRKPHLEEHTGAKLYLVIGTPIVYGASAVIIVILQRIPGLKVLVP